MKWHENLAMLLGVGGLTQLIKWIFDTLKIDESFNSTATLFLSAIFSLLIVILLLLDQLQKENEKIKDFLKTKGFQDEESIFNKMLKLNKAGRFEIDAKVLLVFIVLLFLYLILKSLFLK